MYMHSYSGQLHSRHTQNRMRDPDPLLELDLLLEGHSTASYYKDLFGPLPAMEEGEDPFASEDDLYVTNCTAPHCTAPHRTAP